MYIKTSKKWQSTLEYSMIVLGTLIMGFSFSVFLEPNNISVGGFSALAMIINSLLSRIGISGFPTSAIYLVLNIGLYIIAFKTLGKKFSIKSLLGIVSFSLGMQLFDMLNISITYELLVSAIFGGAIMGTGVGLVVRFGGSTGGSDMIGSIVRSKNKNVSIGTIMIFVDMIIIGLSLFVFTNGFELLPYTVTALLLSMYITDLVNDGYKEVRAFNIITNKPEEISSAIMEQLSRGCSCTTAKGMHSNSDKTIIICLVSKYQTSQLKSIIREIDPTAFVYATRVSEVLGEWNTVSDIHKKSK